MIFSNTVSFFLNLQKKLLDQNFSYATALLEGKAKGNSLVSKTWYFAFFPTFIPKLSQN